MKSQREAVFNAVTSVVGKFEGACSPTDDQRAKVIALVSEGIVAGEVSFSDAAKKKYDTPTKVKGYVGGMVSNWLRKDTKLNGGVKYVAKNPGSRAGQGDDQIKNMRLLKKTLTDPKEISAIDEFITKRQAEIQAEKAANVEINYDVLPTDLLDTLGIELTEAE